MQHLTENHTAWKQIIEEEEKNCDLGLHQQKEQQQADTLSLPPPSSTSDDIQVIQEEAEEEERQQESDWVELIGYEKTKGRGLKLTTDSLLLPLLYQNRHKVWLDTRSFCQISCTEINHCDSNAVHTVLKKKKKKALLLWEHPMHFHPMENDGGWEKGLKKT